MSTKDAPRRTKKKLNNLSEMYKILVHAQDSCAGTTLLCMHNTLVHALEGPGPTKKQPRVRPGAAAFLLSPGLDPWPLQCMHKSVVAKSVVHAQESCACTRILCMHKNLVCSPKMAEKQIVVSLWQ